MTITIQISDSAYEQMLKNKTRVQGTIGLVNPTEGNFNEHHKNWNAGEGAPRPAFKKLTHGRISMTRGTVRMSIAIDRAETNVDPAMVIFDDAEAARYFVQEQCRGEEGCA